MSTKAIDIIVASCKNGGIGKDGKLPWRLKEDMNFFKRVTSEVSQEAQLQGKQNAVVMGRKTYYSIPEKFRPLRNRINIVLSRKDRDLPSGVYQAKSFDSALNLLSSELAENVDNIYIIGGSSLYQLALESPLLRRIYLTKVHSEFDCDTFLPDIDTEIFQEIRCPQVSQETMEENGVRFDFHVLQNIQN